MSENFVHVICDNYVTTSFGLVGEHGFAALVSVGGRKVLFDTGQGMALVANSGTMQLQLSEVEAIALSHGHKDHTGALMEFFDTVGGVKVVAHPSVFDRKVARRNFGGKQVEIPIGIPWSRDELESAGAAFKLTKKPLEIAPGVWFSGEVPMTNDFESTQKELLAESENGLVPDPFGDDAALFLVTERGVTVISGCAHKGIINTMTYAKKLFKNKPVYAVMGGAHLMDAEPERVQKTVKALEEEDVKLVSLGHCTGLPAAFKISQALGERYRFMWVGRRYEV